MYQLESFVDGGALVVNTVELYRATFNAASAEEAEQIVVRLNKPVMLAALATHRFDFEVAGLDVTGGLRVLSDRQSQSQLTNSFTNLKHGLIPDTDWKAANGWQVGALDEIEPIAKAMAAHVRACFRGERVTETAINAAADMADIEAINIAELFSSAYKAAFDEVMTAEQASA